MFYIRYKVVYILLCTSFLLTFSLPAQKNPYSPQRSLIMLKINDDISPYKIMSVSVLPQEKLKLETVLETAEADYRAEAEEGTLNKGNKDNTWVWQAPKKKGVYRLKFFNAGQQDTTVLNCFVAVPYKNLEKGSLNGYQIGNYPKSDKPAYQRPEGFVEVTNENKDTFISPHFQLKEFVSKQGGEYPRYVVLNQRLLVKLEMILEELSAQGYDASKITIMSGYRTPFYNKSIGNVKYSRHQWGDAADIYLDKDGDSLMDDLNKDGKSDVRDARILYRLIDRLSTKSWYSFFSGGLGLYKRNSVRTAFVHVDLRGYTARWGYR